MSYKKYIKRGGKVFGPYIYQSRRVNGKVKTEYLGKAKTEKEDKKLIFLIFSLFFLLFLFFIIIHNSPRKITDFLIRENEVQTENSNIAILRFTIPITNAKHLDENRNFISDISNEVKELDDLWSETISNNEYLRITFEEALSSENDIKIYSRTLSGSPKIEVYEKDKDEKIAEFVSLMSNEYNKVFLNQFGWQGTQDTFDLKILDGSIEVEHIVDPITNINFTHPTPTNATITPNTTVAFNISITETNLSKVIWNWDGTNYTLYNNSLVLMMNFDNVSALGECDTHVVDLSNYSNNGTVNGAVVNTTDCKFGNCFTFDGDDDYLTIDDHSSLDGMSDLTITAWIKMDQLATEHGEDVYILSKRDDDGDPGWSSYYLQIVDSSGDDVVKFAIDCGEGMDGLTGSTDLQKGQWYHITATFNSSDLHVYVNSVLDDAFSTSYPGNIIDTDSYLYINYYSDFNGTMDEVRIYNHALTADEIYELYTSNLYKYDTDKWALYVNQSKNSTDGLDDGTYTYQAFASDSSGNWNQTEVRQITIEEVDTIYPQFSDYKDNNATLVGSGTGHFNITITNTNGTVYLQINNTNITATNYSANPTIFNASYSFTSAGTYTYYWGAWGNGTSHNLNTSNVRYYFVNASPPTPPDINFTHPTQPNATITPNTTVAFNISITETNLSKVIWNWDGTNYTIYNDSLVLMVNLDNVSALGECDTHVVDMSNYSNNGTVSSVPWTSSGKYGGAFSFDGDGYINFGHDSSLAFVSTKDMTYSLWVYLTGTPSDYDAFITDEGQDSTGWGLYYVDSTPDDYLAIWNDDLGNDYDIPLIDQGAWYNIVIVFDYDGSATDLYVYYDGVLVATENDETFASSTGSFALGGAGGGESYQLANAMIDEVRIWNRTLTSAEINQSYMSNLYKYDTNEWVLYVNQSKTIDDGLTNRTYTYQAFASDSSSNWNQTEQRTITIGGVDYEYPKFSNPTSSPLNNATYSFGASYQLNITILSTNTSVGVEFNITNYTASNLSNVFSVSVDDLSVGNYSYYWWAYGNGSQHNYNTSSIYYYNITQAIPEASLTNTTSWTVDYGIAVNISYQESNGGDGDLNYKIYRDNIDVTSEKGLNVSLGIGVYTYLLNSSTEGQNYTINASMDSKTLTITQATGEINGTINGTQGNFTAVNGTATQNIWINATNKTGDGTGKIYVNGTAYNSGTMPLANLTNLSIGFYNITFIYDGNTNYSSDIEVWWVNVTSVEETPSVVTPTPPSGGGGGGGIIISEQCTKDSDCEGDEVCWKNKCVKLFDIKIIDFESPVELGSFFNSTYFLKGMTDINDDVQVNFWIEREGERISFGSDTIYLGSFEEKTEITKIFLPSTLEPGIYQFYIEAVYEDYIAESHRTIEITVEGVAEEGITKIKFYENEKLKNYALIIIALLSILILSLIIKNRIKKKRTYNPKKKVAKKKPVKKVVKKKPVAKRKSVKKTVKKKPVAKKKPVETVKKKSAPKNKRIKLKPVEHIDLVEKREDFLRNVKNP